MMTPPLYAINKNETVQHYAARCPLQRHHHDSMILMLTELQWPTLQTLQTNAKLTLLCKIIYHQLAN